MSELDIIIAARNEMFVNETLRSILQTSTAGIILVLDGEVAVQPIEHKRINIIRNIVAKGQRAATNQGVTASKAKYVMKLDAHCMFAEGFDKRLIDSCDYDTTVIPTMYNLHAFNWVCPECKHSLMQGPEPTYCNSCEKNVKHEMEVIWQPKRHKKTEFYNFDCDLRFQYWNDYRKRPEAQGKAYVEIMGNLGACFMMHRERFWELEGLDEKHGSWGQLGVEVSCKSWLSGGRVIVNRTTWFSHLFRTQKGFTFPYHQSQDATEIAREYSRKLWHGNNWKGQVRPLSWLVNKFAPVPGWSEAQIKLVA